MEDRHYFLIGAFIVYVIIVFYFSKLGSKREIGRRRLFIISFFLTPILGLAFYLSSQHRKMNIYTEKRYKCENCGYVFSEPHKYCPFCEKEGHQYPLKKVTKYMT